MSNAGIVDGGDPLSTPLDAWDRQWRVNVMDHVYGVRAVLPSEWMQRKTNDHERWLSGMRRLRVDLGTDRG